MSEHARATCPDCGEKAVTVMAAPMKPPKMECENCGWDSIEKGDDAADVLAGMTGRPREEFVPDEEVTDVEDQEIEKP